VKIVTREQLKSCVRDIVNLLNLLVEHLQEQHLPQVRAASARAALDLIECH